MKSVSVSCASQITSGSLPRAAREGDTSARGEEPQLAGEVASSLHRSFRGSERVPAFQNTRCCSSCCREHLEIPALEVKGAGNNLAPLDFVDNWTNHLTEAPVRVPTVCLLVQTMTVRNHILAEGHRLMAVCGEGLHWSGGLVTSGVFCGWRSKGPGTRSRAPQRI